MSDSLRICATCPWLRANHGKPHPGDWYRKTNLQRLWNGLRTAKAPGMVCHSSDPQAADYGSTNTVHPESKPRECAGALMIVVQHVNECSKTVDWNEYRRRHSHPLTRSGLGYWVSRHLFGKLPAIDSYRADEIGLPWE